jgi:histidine phosphotransferase ChpT
MSGPSEPLDPVTLSALLASRLCHDLINPVGAIGSGLEVLGEPGMDQEMKDTALALIESGGKKSIALLKYGRLAYGAAGGFGAEIPMEEAEAALKEVYALAKAELDWRVPGGLAAKELVKTLLILAFAAADCVPRGGRVAVSASGAGYAIEATGPRVILQQDLVRAAAGDTGDLKPKFAPAYIAGLMARAAGGDIAIALEDEKVVMRANFDEKASLTAVR